MPEEASDLTPQFTALHQTYLAEAAGIDGDEDLTPAAKARLLDEARQRGGARFDQLMAAEAQAINDEFAAARRSLGMGAIGRGGGSAEDASHRQALDTAWATKTASELGALMARGYAESDRALEHAAFVVALERFSDEVELTAKSGRGELGKTSEWERLVKSYAERHPATAANLNRFGQAGAKRVWLRYRRPLDLNRSRSVVVPRRQPSPPKPVPAGRYGNGGALR